MYREEGKANNLMNGSTIVHALMMQPTQVKHFIMTKHVFI